MYFLPHDLGIGMQIYIIHNLFIYFRICNNGAFIRLTDHQKIPKFITIKSFPSEKRPTPHQKPAPYYFL